MDAARSPDRRLCCGRSQRNKTKRSGKLQVRGALHGHCCGMIARHITRFLGPALIAASSLSAAALAAPLIPSAAAQCPDVQVVFARGTGEPPGVGPTRPGLRRQPAPRLGGKSFDVYPVNYPASDQWDTGLDGIRDAGAHVVSMAHDCPSTKMVLATPRARPSWVLSPRPPYQTVLTP